MHQIEVIAMMIPRLTFSKGLLYRTCLVCHMKAYTTKKVIYRREFKPEAGSAVKPNHAPKPEAKRTSKSEAGNDSDYEEGALPNKITASTPFTFKQWKAYGGKIYERRLKYLVKAKNVSFHYIHAVCYCLHGGYLGLV